MFSFSESKGIWVVSLSGDIQYLYKPDWTDEFGGWTSNQSFLVYEWVFEGPKGRLREINILLRTVQELYPGDFRNYTYNPEDQSIILNLSNGAYWHFDLPDGLYNLNPEEQSVTLFASGNFGSVNWNSILNRYVARRSSLKTKQANYQITLFDSVGNLDIQFDNAGGRFEPSPNGAWIIAGDSAEKKLFSSNGTPVKDVGMGNVYWLSDSSGFYRIDAQLCAEPGNIYFHIQSQSWEPVLVENNISPCSFVLVNP
jgi:hypothetical protein